ncbi:MAG: leucine-rich repeat protein, partial [Clostridia bacterium]|nr:leucine-rich repeat protein [Clostridia bacterium]
EGYTLTINDSEVTHGEGTTITFSLKEGYTDSSAIIKINGEEITLSDGQYVIENITADQQIIVQDVEKNKYAVKFVNPDGTTAAESQEIKYQEYAETPAEPTFEETPQYRYEFKGWALVNGGEMVTVGDIQITEATTFIAQYDEIAIEYTITLPETMQNYSITYDKTEYPEDIKLTCEDEFAFTIVLDEGYDEDVPEVTIDETKATLTSVGANQYTITNIQGNVTINVAEPKINEYVLTFEELENCDITVTRDGEELNNNAVVKHGDELIITYTTTDGYKIEGLTVTNTIEEDGVYKVTGDVNISYQIGQFKNILLNVDGKQANIYLEEDTDLLLGIEGKTEYNDETTCGWYYEPTLQTPVQSGTTVTEGIEIYTRKATVDKLSFEENSDGTWKVGMASSEEEGDIVVPRMHQGKTVTYINAFYGNAITGLVIPNTINSYRDEGGLIIIGSLRENLTSIIVVGDNTTFDSRPVDNVNNAPSNAIIETATDTLLAGCQATTIPTNVKKIRKDAMYSAGFKGSLQIPASVTEIGEDAFVSNPEMTEVHIYGKINEIANGLFSGCSSLANIEIADSSSITRIGESAFNG